MASRHSPRIMDQEIHNCFGIFDGNNVDLSGLSPVQALGKVSAIAMLTTERVGRVTEDSTMAQARPRLSRINERGLVTFDSQMGVKEGSGSELHWQRSYVVGMLPRQLARKFMNRMRLVDGVTLYVNEFKNIPFNMDLQFVPVTRYGDEMHTSVPMTSVPFEEGELLPAVESIMHERTCRELVKDDAIRVAVVDTVWGRPFWLFEKISDVLDEVHSEG